MNPWVLLVLAYLLGSVPTSWWVGRAVYGVDLREKGSGNLGATNTFRVLGWRAALPVVAFDIFKGWLPAAWFAEWGGGLEFGWVMAFGAAAIAGHVFSLFANFRGGKGVATSAGVFLGLAPIAVGVCLALFVVLVRVTRMVSVGSLAAAIALPPLIAFTPHQGGTALLWFALVLSAFVIWAHRTNVGRLLRGEENRFGSQRAAAGAGAAAEAGEEGR
ncbi:MAG: glycerol-3-phosphate 1-O-acyltransferase PlsY [Gemmatimonadetes bacterium]|nr:glycerol-3-phosphate 1-O-acyltransferase PlsY [Gemmatimonadota bacterium]NNK64470.1 glycerol-3-phosphate 1-O-acyltransferase PlsY [Gemmatimonadota bacterium]